jgi:hypothetical protein
VKTKPVKAKNGVGGKPFEVVKIGNVSVPIYRHSNIIPRRDAAGKIIYGPPDDKGKLSVLVEYRSDIYTLAYYEGANRIRQKFSNLDKARQEANVRPPKLPMAKLRRSSSKAMTEVITFAPCKSFRRGIQTPT